MLTELKDNLPECVYNYIKEYVRTPQRVNIVRRVINRLNEILSVDYLLNLKPYDFFRLAKWTSQSTNELSIVSITSEIDLDSGGKTDVTIILCRPTEIVNVNVDDSCRILSTVKYRCARELSDDVDICSIIDIFDDKLSPDGFDYESEFSDDKEYETITLELIQCEHSLGTDELVELCEEFVSKIEESYNC